VRLARPVSLPARRGIGFPARAFRTSTAAAAIIACAVGLGTFFGSVGTKSPSLSANATRLSQGEIISGPGTEADTLIRAPRLAMLKAQLGIGKQRGVGIVDI
jgi:hypothetical protein